MSNFYGEMEAVLGDHQIFDPDRIRHHVIGVAQDLDSMVSRIEALEAAREQEEKDMAEEKPSMKDRTVKCNQCEVSFVGPTAATEALEMLDRHRKALHPKLRPSVEGRPSRKVVRWTITGEGAALDSAEVTWKRINRVVEHANAEGLRVSVSEVEEETR